MEHRYQGRWDVHMMADYVWSLKRDCPYNYGYRKASRTSFLPKQEHEKWKINSKLNNLNEIAYKIWREIKFNEKIWINSFSSKIFVFLHLSL